MLEAYFRLGFETHTTDLVLAEVHQPVEIYVLRGQLKVTVLTDVEFAGLLMFKSAQPTSLSLQDCSALQLALQRDAILLTGDNKLRNHAEKKCRLESHGVLWIFDLLVEDGFLNHDTAADCLQTLVRTNPRLPVDECEKRLKMWAEGRGISPRRPPKK